MQLLFEIAFAEFRFASKSMWPTRLLYISLACIGAGLACDRNACNVGTSVGVGVASTVSAVGWWIVGGADAAAAFGSAKEACGYCDGSDGGFSSEEFRNLTEQVLEAEQRLQKGVVDSETRIRDEVLDSEQQLGQNITQLDKETKDLIRRRSQMVLDTLKEFDKNLTKWASQMVRDAWSGTTT